MNKKFKNLLIIMISLVVLGMGLSGFSKANAADKDNCLMCHKYPLLARIGEDNLEKNYFISEHVFMNSLHGLVGCRECHTYIKKIPHDPVTEKVNCANQCHIKPPFSDKDFSHTKIIDVFETSVHAIKPGASPLLKASDPDCKYCHLNPIYRRPFEKQIAYGKTLNRCLNCHPKKGVSQAYRHVMHRLGHKTSRSSRAIVSLCAGCHENVPLMKKLKLTGTALDAVETYRQSIHGKMTALGSEKAANCISCHASSLIHDIYTPDNPKSSINEAHLQATCKNCHKKINKYFVKIAVHPNLEDPHNPILFIISNLILRMMLYGTTFGLMGLLFLETFRRKRDGIHMRIKRGTSWRREKKQK